MGSDDQPNTNSNFDNTVTGLIWMLNGNINESRKEVLATVENVREEFITALKQHEEAEMGEINELKNEIKVLQGWKNRGIFALGLLFVLGLIDNNAIDKLLQLKEGIG